MSVGVLPNLQSQAGIVPLSGSLRGEALEAGETRIAPLLRRQ